jgi:hypothetical protein
MRRDDQRLSDILEGLDWIARVVLGKSEAEFLADETLCYAVAQRLTVIGEAVARLSPEVKAQHSSVPWQDIVVCAIFLCTSTLEFIGRWSGKRLWTMHRFCGRRWRLSVASNGLTG